MIHLRPDNTKRFREIQQRNDEMFRARTQKFPEALTLDFWKDQFCTREALDPAQLKGHILDLGCGSGEIDIFLARAGRVVTGCDISPFALQLARAHWRNEAADVRARLSFVYAEGGRLPFPDQTFDSVLLSHVLEHLAHPTPTLKEIARVLRPGGNLLVLVPLDHAFDDPTHAHHFHASDLQKLLQHYFESIIVTEHAEAQHLKAVCSNSFPARFPRIICQMRIRNEARWLKEVLDSIAPVADGIVILDDGSTDETPAICRSHPAVVDYVWQNEPVQDQVRDKTRHFRMALAHRPEWVLSMDGDEVLEDSAAERIFEAIRTSPADVSVLCFRFLYMWNDRQHYRTDGIYRRIFHPRLFKLEGQDISALYYAPTEYRGNGHCRSVPENLRGRSVEIDVMVKHLGYMPPENRRARYERYRQRDPEHFARGDYEHLLDQPHMTLEGWEERPFRRQGICPPPSFAGELKQERKPDYYYSVARPNIAALVPLSARRILDVGCGHGATGALLRQRNQAEVIGIEIHEQAAAVARQNLSQVLVGDVESIAFPFPDGYFDCIILADILEHLVNPWRTLQKLARYLQPSGTVVASIPNVRNLNVIRKLLSGSWSYEEWGILDRSHLRFFTMRDMEELFRQAGFDARVADAELDPDLQELLASPSKAVQDIDGGKFLLRAVTPDELRELCTRQFILVAQLKQPVAASDYDTAEPAVSIVIPVFNNLSYTRQCITSLFLTKERTPFEVIVVDDGSTDGTAEYLASLPTPIRSIRLSQNRGFAAACNAGAAAARGRFLVFLNNDTIVLPGWLDSMVECIQSDPRIGVVGNLQIFPESGLVQQAGIVCGANGIVRSIYNNELPATHPAVNKPREFQFVAGSCLLIEKTLFRDLGGFDEAYRNSCEDVDLCMKVRAAGRKVFYCPQSRILHYESKTVLGHDKNSANYRRFLDKWQAALVRDDVKYLEEDGFLPASLSPVHATQSL